mgnify:CR=1 FL=1
MNQLKQQQQFPVASHSTNVQDPWAPVNNNEAAQVSFPQITTSHALKKLPQNDYFEDCLYFDCGDDANNNNNLIKTDDEMDFGSNSTDDDEEVFNTNFMNNSSSVVTTSFSKSLNDIHENEKVVPTRPNSLAISTADNFSCIDYAVSTFLFSQTSVNRSGSLHSTFQM